VCSAATVRRELDQGLGVGGVAFSVDNGTELGGLDAAGAAGAAGGELKNLLLPMP